MREARHTQSGHHDQDGDDDWRNNPALHRECPPSGLFGGPALAARYVRVLPRAKRFASAICAGVKCGQCARIRIERGADGCRASPSPPAGTSRTPSRGCPICRAPSAYTSASLTCALRQALLGRGQQPSYRLRPVAFDGIAVIVHAVVVQDAEIALRGGVARFGGLEQPLLQAVALCLGWRRRSG